MKHHTAFIKGGLLPDSGNQLVQGTTIVMFNQDDLNPFLGHVFSVELLDCV